MDDQLPYYKTVVTTTNLVTGEVKSVELHKTHEPVYTPIYRRSEPTELFREYYLYPVETVVGMTVELTAVADDDKDGQIGIFKRFEGDNE